ncbi:hypothetical protein KXR53_21785 [Inquilinus limosus]|uniref:hypothetical protein n=1 Tax=Inquilinus limosus TaxID=171674 RepID=UPI003F182EF0
MTFLVLGAALGFALLAYAADRLAPAEMGRAPLALRPASRFGRVPQPDEFEATDPAWASFMRAM